MGLLVDLNRSTLQDEAVNQQVYRLMEIWKKIQNWGDELMLLMRQDNLRLDQRSLVEVGSLCADVQRELRLEFDIPGSSRLCIQVDEPGLQLRTDREVLTQVLKGLVGRARERSAANGEVHLDIHEFHNKVYFEVSDDGPPISVTGMLNVFGRSTEIATQPLGGGFDLARAKLIVEKMGGKLWIGGHKARGSTITVSLPTSGSQDTL
jgi:two-component system sensor histidine kinase KdpD